MLPKKALREIPSGIKVLTSSTPYQNAFSRARLIRTSVEFALQAIRLDWNIQSNVIIATSTPLTAGSWPLAAGHERQ